MTIHEFGKEGAPVLLLLPGTTCYWKANFEKVLPGLCRNFRVGVAAYTGFDENDTENFVSMTDEVERIEEYIKANYSGHIHAAYGCSLGGSFVAMLADRNNITMQYGILGSSDLDEASPFKAKLMSRLMTWLLYPYIHTGRYKLKVAQKKMDRRMAENDPYNKAFVSIVGRDRYDMSFISKESFYQQFYSDLVTTLPDKITLDGGKIHILYAKKMGEKYLRRYRKHFADPIIHEHGLRHEELLGVYPDEWVTLITTICTEEKI